MLSFRTTNLLLALAVAITVVSADAVPKMQKRDPRMPLTMRAVPDSVITGITRRAWDYSALDLRPEGNVVYAAPLETGEHAMLAEMKCTGTPFQPVVVLDKAEHLFTEERCVEVTGGEAVVELSFVEEAAATYAMEQWEGVNEDEERTILLVGSIKGCGKEEEHAPYIVHTVALDTESRKMSLSATLTRWSDLASNLEISFAKAEIGYHAHTELRKRNIFTEFGDEVSEEIDEGLESLESVWDAAVQTIDSIDVNIGVTAEMETAAVADAEAYRVSGGEQKEVEDNVNQEGLDNVFSQFSSDTDGLSVLDWADFDYPWNQTFDLSSGEENKTVNLFTDPFKQYPRLQIDCVSCFIKGKVDLGGSIKIVNGEVTELSWSFDPSEIIAHMEIDVRIMKSVYSADLSEINLSKNIFSVPFGGIVIPGGVFALGPKLDYEMGFAFGMSSILNFTFGVEAKIPEGAIVKGDVLHPENTVSEGWEGTSVDLIPFTVNQALGNANAAFFAMPVISFGLNVLDKLGFESAMKVKSPIVNVNASAVYDPEGACAHGEAEPATGVKFSSGASFELWYYAGEDKAVGEKALFERKLTYSKLIPWETCVATDLPALTGYEGSDEATQTGENPKPSEMPATTSGAAGASATAQKLKAREAEAEAAAEPTAMPATQAKPPGPSITA